jgi:hypothetical protein
MCDLQASQQDNKQPKNKLTEEEIEVAIILHNLSEIKKSIGIMNILFNIIVEGVYVIVNVIQEVINAPIQLCYLVQKRPE